MPPSRQELEARARVIRALAHPTRLMVMEELQRSRRSVGDLAAKAGCDISTMSRHLSVLRNCGIVAVEKSASTVLCRLATPCIIDFFHCIDRVLSGDSEPCAENAPEKGCRA